MHRLAVAGILPVLFAAVAGAQSPPAVVTETEFLSVLMESHPAVAALRGPVAEAEADAAAASTLANPELDIDREDPSGAGEQLELTLSWALPRSSRRLEIESAERSAEAAAARLSEEALALRLTLRRVYADWAVASARGEKLSAQLGHVARLADRELARAERGETSRLEAQRLVLAAAGLRARLALVEAEAASARAEARGWAPELSADALPMLPPLPPVAGIPVAGIPVTGIDGPHPRLSGAAAEVAAAELAERAAGRFLASPELTAGWQRQDLGADTVEGPLLGLSWSLPVFDRHQARRARAEARLATAKARLELAERETRAERAGAVETYRHLAQAAAEAAATLEANNRLSAGAVAAFRHGEASLTDLLETLSSIADSETAALDLHAAALAAHHHLERQAGHPLDLLLPPGETP